MRNGLLTSIGLIIIAISLVAVVSIGNSSYQRALTKKSQSSSSDEGINLNASQIRFVHIPYGAGKPDFRSIFFVPPRTNIHPGETVKWINDDSVSHTVTSATFNSGMIWPSKSIQGNSEFTMNFKTPGTYAYFCQMHPYMSGIVYVGVHETQRVLKNPATNNIDVKIEMPQNTAYLSNYGPYFIPSYAIAPSGAKVTWTNKDYIPHTATSADGSFDTEAIGPGKSTTINLIHNTGTISYYCEIHPWMQATIQIENTKTHPTAG
jgi:plastocyanin